VIVSDAFVLQPAGGIAFNVASLRKSIIMATSDYLAICGGKVADFSKE
jgi:hypothetical protein